MRARALTIAGFVVVALAVACSSKSSGHFPYLGPSCTTSNTFYSDACWQCSQDHCSVGCEPTDCAAYFQCYCECEPGGPLVGDSGLSQDNACQAACAAQMTSACATCRDTLGQCQGRSCGSSCGYLDAG